MAELACGSPTSLSRKVKPPDDRVAGGFTFLLSEVGDPQASSATAGVLAGDVLILDYSAAGWTTGRVSVASAGRILTATGSPLRLLSVPTTPGQIPSTTRLGIELSLVTPYAFRLQSDPGPGSSTIGIAELTIRGFWTGLPVPEPAPLAFFAAAGVAWRCGRRQRTMDRPDWSRNR